jgi:hypothetical protein
VALAGKGSGPENIFRRAPCGGQVCLGS